MSVARTSASPTLTDLLFERAEAGLCLVAPDGTVLRVNSGWLRSTGYSLDEVLGADIVALFPGTRDMAIAMHAHARAGHHVDVPRHAQRIDGRETWWEGSIDPVPLDGGTGLLITAREVSGGPASGTTLFPGEIVSRDAPARAPAAPVRPGWQAWAWLVVPVAFVASVTLDAAELDAAWGAPGLIAGLNFVFLTVGSAMVALLAGRSFWRHGTPGLLLLGAGALVFAMVAPVSILVGGADPNVNVTVYNLGALVAGGCHLGAAVSLLERRAPLPSRARWLLAVYAGGAAAVLAIAALAHAGAFPAFFVQGRGGTVPRQLVLGLAVAAFAIAAALIAAPGRDAASTFRHWYGIALGLVATGLFTVLIQESFNSPLSWLGRAVQYLGGVVMLAAALVTARREPGVPLSLDAMLREVQERYRALFHHMTEGAFVAEVIRDAAGKPVDYRYLDVNPAFERLTGLPRRAVVGRTVREVLPGAEETWIETYGRVALTGVPAHLEGFAAPLGRHYETSAYSPAIGQFACMFVDVTERRRAEAELRENEARFRAMFEHTTDAVVLVDPEGEGRVLSANPSACRMFGYSAAEFATVDRQTMVDEADPRVAAFVRARGESGATVAEITYVRKDGSRFVGEVTSALFEAAPGKLAVAIIRDVTERKRAEHALLEADRNKNEFLGMLSHELRNPLAPIRNSAYVLRNAAPGSDAARRAGEVIDRQAQHLTRLVDDLLDVTRIARGKIQLQRARVDLREVVRRAADDHRLPLEHRGVAFRTELPEAEVWADVDVTRLTQVVGNLLHNAAKFTRRGDEVALALTVSSGEAVLRVRDTGAGIDPDLLPRVFEPFVQGERTLARTEGGLGLGLALVKGIAELHGGRVHVESPGTGRGAEFTVCLPLAPAEGARPARRGASEGAGSGRRVLVVDDNADAAASLADVLRLRGHEVDVAHDGPAALAALHASRIDVVLCDIGLPGMSGYEVARAVRTAEDGHVRLVALTGYAQPEDVQRAIEAGFDAHVAKPPDPDELERLIA